MNKQLRLGRKIVIDNIIQKRNVNAPGLTSKFTREKKEAINIVTEFTNLIT